MISDAAGAPVVNFPGCVRPRRLAEIDEHQRFQDRAALNFGYEERRGAQTIGEAALRVVHGLATLPRRNTSELKIAVIADLPVADLAGGHVVQPADAEVDRQAVGERVREASVRAGCFVDGAHAVPLDFARGSRSSDARYSTQ